MITPNDNSPISESMMDSENDQGNEMHTEDKKYDDPKYTNVLKALIELGFYGSKFLGASGYYIPSNPDYQMTHLICQNPDDGFKINIRGGHVGVGDAAQYSSEILSLTEIVDQLNAILADATTADTKDRHVNESTKYRMEISDPDGKIAELIDYIKQTAHAGHGFPVVVDPDDKDYRKEFYIDGDGSAQIIDFKELNESVIEAGSTEFGKPGTYLLFRNGVDKTLRGLISFSDHYQGADIYKNKENPLPTKKYLVKIKNPLVINGQTSVGAFRTAYRTILGKEVNLDNPKKTINDMWRAADKKMAAGLTKAGYDALIYKVPNVNEVLVVGTDISKIPAISEYTESVKNIANAPD